MEFIYKDPNHKRESITGVRFKPHPDGPVYILQHPLWEVTDTPDPDESIEEFENRKKIEG
jgi:hypothetical protein